MTFLRKIRHNRHANTIYLISTLKHILFVCTGNTCRSPMAEGLFFAAIADKKDYTVSSAGIGALNGMPASKHTLEILAEDSIDLSSHSSKSLTKELVERATYIFTMTHAHKQTVESLYPESAEKTFLLGEFFSPEEFDHSNKDIPDPVGLGKGAYQETRDSIKKALPNLIDFIEKTSREKI